MDRLAKRTVEERGLIMDDYKKKFNGTPREHKPQDLRHGNNIYRACLSKKKYHDYNFALKKAEELTKLFGKKHYVYYCPYCFKYHMTTLPRRDEDKKGENND